MTTDVPSQSPNNEQSMQNTIQISTPRFNDHTDTDSATQSRPAKTLQPKTRAPRKNVNLAQSVTLENDDDLGPLGPLGASVEETAAAAPIPPVKELATRQRPVQLPSQTAQDDDGRSSLFGGEPRRPQSVQSVPVEQAAKPTFKILVGDPHTVGGTASSHTVYAVTTTTSSKAYNTSTFTVSRRYRDFLWLYEQLHTNNPGVVVAPPPEKQTMGRFDAEFIEHRRQALERMINKIASHPILQNDADLKTFLESDAFNVDIKHKDRGRDVLAGSESKGLMSTIGFGGSGGGKFIEHDDWFHDRRVYLDALENQLKALQKSLDAVIAQRRSLAESCGDFSTSLHTLAGVEISPSLSGPLDALGDLQRRVQELYTRQAMQDILTLGIVIEEYIRLIGSVKKAFDQRQKAFHAWHSAETRLLEVKKQQDKLLRAGRSQQDRIAQMSADVGDAERRVHQARLLFEDMGRLMRTELDRFEREKVDDFKSGVETFLESAVEAQKEVSWRLNARERFVLIVPQLIELWETYLLQLDSEEDGPPLVPVGVRADKAASAPPSNGLTTEDETGAPSNADVAPTTEVNDDHAEDA